MFSFDYLGCGSQWGLEYRDKNGSEETLEDDTASNRVLILKIDELFYNVCMYLTEVNLIDN